jgi:hypothetical protein
VAALATPRQSMCNVMHARLRLAAVGATLQVSPSSKRTNNIRKCGHEAPHGGAAPSHCALCIGIQPSVTPDVGVGFVHCVVQLAS